MMSRLLLVLVVCLVCVLVQSASDPRIEYFDSSNAEYGSSHPQAALKTYAQSLEFLTYDAPNYCRFYKLNTGTRTQDDIAVPKQPSEWYDLYRNSGGQIPPLTDAEKATVTVALFHFQFNDTVWIKGHNINDPFWWKPDATGLAQGSSFDPYTVGCKVDPKSAAVVDSNTGSPAPTPLPTPIQRPDISAEVPVDTADFFDYARAYRIGKTVGSTLRKKLPNKYCPYLDPFPRYPIWRDKTYSTFSAWELTLEDASGTHKLPNHAAPQLNVQTNAPELRTCGLPYYSFIIPKSATVPDSTLLLLAQQMLPMPDDLLDNAFTIVHWMSTYSHATQDLTTRVKPSGLETGNPIIKFKTPNERDRLLSCAAIDFSMSDYTDGQVIPSMTGFSNDTNRYEPTPDPRDNPPNPQRDNDQYWDSGSIEAYYPEEYYAGLIVVDDNQGTLVKWDAKYPRKNPCDIRRNGEYDPVFRSWSQYTCGVSGAVVPYPPRADGLSEFDGKTTVGWCIDPADVKSTKWAITDAFGNPLQAAFYFDHPNSKPCSPDDFAQLQLEANFLIANLTNSQTLSEAAVFQAALSRLSTRFAFGACFKFLKSMFITKTVTVPVPGPPTKVCTTSAADTVAFANDPCCNPSLAFYQCCNNTATSQKSTVSVASFDSSLTTNCRNATLAAAAILDFQAASNALQAAPVVSTGSSVSQVWNGFLDIRTQCYQLIHNATCSKDSDCISKECDIFRAQCIVPYDSLEQVTLDCLLSRLQNPLRTSFLDKLGLAADATAAQVETAFRAQVMNKDCVGPTAANYTSRTVYDPITGTQYVIPGDEAQCEADKRCSYETDKPEECTKDLDKYKGSSFCGVCHGASCWEISQQPKCIVTSYISKTSCERGGYYWLANVGDSFFDDLDGECLNIAAKTQSDCLPTPVCPRPLFNRIRDDSYRCQGSICYNPAVVTQNDCRDGQWAFGWGNGNGLCTTFYDAALEGTPNYVPCPAGYSPHLGYKWIPGKFETEAKCNGLCSLRPDYRQFGGQDPRSFDSTQCGQHSQCTQGCPKCVSQNTDDEDPFSGQICYDPSIKSPSNSVCGQRRNAVVFGKTRSLFGQLVKSNQRYRGGTYKREVCAYNLNATECASAGYTLVSCNTLNRQQCGQTTVNPYAKPMDEILLMSLNCAWDPSAPCLSQTECEATGRCDDEQFVNYDNIVNGLPSTGGCVFKPKFEGRSAKCEPCDRQESKFYSFYSFLKGKERFRWRRPIRLPGWCIDLTYPDKESCIADRGEWEDKADTKAECDAHGSYCVDLASGSQSSRSGSSCTNCGGVIQPAYNWETGHWVQGFMRTTKWVPREYRSVNQWINTVNYTKLEFLLTASAAPIVTSSVSAADQYQALTRMINIMSQLVCDCTDPTTPNDNSQPVVAPGRTSAQCYTTNNALAPAVVTQVYDLLPSQWATSGATLTFVAGSGGSSLTVHEVPVASTWKISGTTSTGGTTSVAYRRLLGVDTDTTSNTGAVAVDSTTGLVQGMVVGRGQRITVNVTPGSLTIVFNVESTLVNLIDRSIYYEPAVGIMRNNRIEILSLADVTMLNQESAIRTSSISTTGEYYAVFKAGPKRTVPEVFLVKSTGAANNLQLSVATIVALLVAVLALLF